MNYNIDDTKLQERFWKKVVKGDNPNACWVWIGSKSWQGYGQFSAGGKPVRAYRISYQIAYGQNSISDGLWVLHKCNNKACVNPLHLKIGTCSENEYDKRKPIPIDIIVIDPDTITIPTPQEKLLERFWSKVDVLSENECWNWKGYKNKFGYGMFRYKGRMHYSPRISWLLNFGEIPHGKFACHSCDNPSCVNPSHLWLGTQAENMRDCSIKGRNKNRNVAPKYKNFSEDTISSILEMRQNGETLDSISKKMSLTVWHINMVLKNN